MDITWLDGETSGGLPPPPRLVSWRVFWSFVFGQPFAVASGLFLAIGLFVLTLVALSDDWSGAWHLETGCAYTTGRITRSAPSSIENDRPRYRQEYVYSLPDGRTIQGAGFSTAPARVGETVRVAYALRHPRTSRIPGASPGPFPFAAVWPMPCWLLLLGGAGLSYGLIDARMRCKLLERGLPTMGRITRIRIQSPERHEVPFDQFHAIPQRPFTASVRLGGLLWMCAGLATLVLGLTFCGGVLRREFFEGSSVSVLGRQVGSWLPLVFVGLCSVAVLVLSMSMIVQGGRWLSTPAIDPAGLLALPRLTLNCEFEYSTENGAVLHGRCARAVFLTRERLHAEQRVLYDPARRRATLLDGLFPPVAYSTAGLWESAWPVSPARKLFGLAASLVLAPLLASVVWLFAMP